MTEIENTAKTNANMARLSRATGVPVGALVTPGSIEAMEAAGQAQLVQSSLLPTEMHNDRAEFEALGFVFGEVVADDPLFTEVRLPEGWRKEGSDHDMWSYVVDDKGERRVAVFYKAAFYDRGAFMRIEAN